MSRLNNYAAIWFAVVLIIGYVTLYSLTEFIFSKFIADFLAIIGLAFMSASTTPVAYRAFLNGIRTDRDKFIFSYWMIWTMALVHRCWITIIGLTDIDYLRYSPVSGLIAVMFALATTYGGIAPMSGEVPLQRREVIIYVLAGLFSGIIAGISMTVFIVSGWEN